MRDREWALSADDALDRRSKIGLRLSADEREHVARWWRQQVPGNAGHAL